MKIPILATAALSVLALAVSAGAPAGASAARAPRGHTHPAIHVRGAQPQVTPQGTTVLRSNNWAGWVALRKKTSQHFNSVDGDFSIPSLNCNATPGPGTAFGTYVSNWVGLDGWSDSTVEQDGITGFCDPNTNAPTYYAWFEMFPEATVVTSLAVSPGDDIHAAVVHTGSKYILAVNDVTTGQRVTESAACPSGSSCARSSAEVISEAPFEENILPLADFGMTNFEDVGINLGSTFGAFRNSAWTNDEIEQIGPSSGKVIDQPTGVYGGVAFSDRWLGEN